MRRQVRTLERVTICTFGPVTTIFSTTGAERPIVREILYRARLADRKPLEDYGLPPKVRGIYREAHFALRNEQPILAAIGIRRARRGRLRRKKGDRKRLGEAHR
jgi:hypothetical protein